MWLEQASRLGTRIPPRLSPASAGLFLCAEHDRQLGGGSPLSSLMVAKD
jgi:hypothetical protein